MSEIFETVFFTDDRFTDLIPITVGHHNTPPGNRSYGNRPYHLVHYVEDGCGELYIDGKRFKVKGGQMFFIPKGCAAEYISDSKTPWKYSWISFNGTYADKLPKLPSPVADLYFFPFDDIKSNNTHMKIKEETVLSVLYKTFAELFGEQKAGDDYITQTENIIKSSYMSGVTVFQIASKIGLDRRYLSKIFSERKGISIKAYITNIRMQAAKLFLLEGKSVALTSELVGYNDQFNFSKMFKKHFGISPSEMRKTQDM